MTTWPTVKVEPVGVDKTSRVAVGSPEQQVEGIAWADVSSREGERLRRPASDCMSRGVEPGELFEGDRPVRAPGAQRFGGFGVGSKRENGISEEESERAVARCREVHGEHDEVLGWKAVIMVHRLVPERSEE